MRKKVKKRLDNIVRIIRYEINKKKKNINNLNGEPTSF